MLLHFTPCVRILVVGPVCRTDTPVRRPAVAPDAVIVGDEAAVLAGTPRRIDGRDEVATFFDGAAQAAFSALVDGRPGAAWYLRGEARVAFDFTVVDGQVTQIAFRAAPELLAGVVRREGAEPR